MSKIIKRLRIPLHGNERTEFVTKKGLLIAKGYVRVIDGGRGPYIEFRRDQIQFDNLYVPKECRWRFAEDEIGKNAYYFEYRSMDAAYVKVYRQKRTVSYADYKIGLWYISPEDVIVSGFGEVFVKPVQQGSLLAI